MRVDLLEWLAYDGQVALPRVDTVLRQVTIKMTCGHAPQSVGTFPVPLSVTSFHDGTSTAIGRVKGWTRAQGFDGVLAMDGFELGVEGTSIDALGFDTGEQIAVRGSLHVMSVVEASDFDHVVAPSDWQIVGVAFPPPDDMSSRYELELRPVAVHPSQP